MAAKRRAPDFDLRAAIRRAEFTPAGSDVAPLLALVAGDDEDAARDATIALLRIAPKAAEGLVRALAEADVPSTVRLARLAARLPKAAARPILVGLVRSSESRVRRAGASALGRLGGGLEAPARTTAAEIASEGHAGESAAADLEVESALLDAWPGEDPAERRALAEALGKAGGERAASLLATVDPGDDPELRRIVEKARLMRVRDAARGAAVALDADADAGEPLAIELFCRSGLEGLLFDELRFVDALAETRILGQGRVAATLRGPPSALARARLYTEFAFVLPVVPSDRDPVEAVVEALTSARATTILRTFTRGAARLRIDWEGRGPQRALTWKIAAALAARGLVNDSREAPWEARIQTTARGALRVALVPRGFADTRFAWRNADVPAASHPTVAAAIARFAGVMPNDVVWDPFTGSGAELIECALLGPHRALYGTDLDPDALVAARSNLVAAKVDATLTLADATTFEPPLAPTLIVSNPPMGRRVHRGDVGPLLESFLGHLATIAAPSAHLVWITPIPRRTTPYATSLGFRLDRAIELDMGGFPGRLERWLLP